MVQLNNEVPELSIVNEDGSTIFSDDTIEYIVPLYQRAYAWETKERLQLIDDICDCDADEYFLGSLVVNKRIDTDKNIYEVVDGQQRLTTLYILLKCLDYDVKNTLTFECRGKSNNSLRKLETLENEDLYQSLRENCKNERENISDVKGYCEILVREYEKLIAR